MTQQSGITVLRKKYQSPERALKELFGLDSKMFRKFGAGNSPTCSLIDGAPGIA
jgi:hypothetical protein